jgi:methyltransferase-like protein/SAM-dependent methyltransferase
MAGGPGPHFRSLTKGGLKSNNGLAQSRSLCKEANPARAESVASVTDDRVNDGTTAVAAANARIGARYDEMPYVSQPRRRNHPARIAMIAQLLGLTPPRPMRASVLEIGCGSGGSIIPLAAEYPDARFVGIDVSEAHITSGLARIDRLGLANIELIRGDLVDFSPGQKKFDYVLCHGVYSWTPIEVRPIIQSLIAASLAPEGIAYVSYNVLPGWRLKQALRDVLRTSVLHLPDLASKVAGARAVLALLRGWRGEKDVYGSNLRLLAGRLDTLPDFYLAHEYLEENNEPQTFTEFVKEAEQAGLAYLGDLDLWMTLPENFDPEVRRLLNETCGGALMPTEQMIDVLLGREFRRSLLVHEAVAPRVSRELDSSRIEDLNFLGRLVLDEASSSDAWTFLGRDNRKLSVSAPWARVALETMSRAYPATVTLDDLVKASNVEGWESAQEVRGRIAHLLFTALTSGLIDARVDPVCVASTIEARPCAPRHCRIDALAGESAVATLAHDPYFVNDSERFLLPLLDGTRDRDALVSALLEQVVAGAVQFSKDGVAEGELAAIAGQEIDRALEALRAAGLLAAPVAADKPRSPNRDK